MRRTVPPSAEIEGKINELMAAGPNALADDPGLDAAHEHSSDLQKPPVLDGRGVIDVEVDRRAHFGGPGR